MVGVMLKGDLPPRLSAEAEVRGEVLRVGQRFPFVAVRVLALIVWLDGKVPFLSEQPGHLTRDQIAAYLDVTTIAMDKVLDQYQGNLWLTKRYEIAPGRKPGRIARLTFYDPSPKLRALIRPLLRG